MARPSKSRERTEQIVNATISVMATHGYAGTTLDRIAAQAGLARGHVRHFVGNRQELIRQTAHHYYFPQGSEKSLFPPDIDSVSHAIDFLFSDAFIGERDENTVVFGFIEASRSDPEISRILVQAYAGTESLLAQILKRESPQATSDECAQVAFALVAVAIHNIFLLDISVDLSRTETARASAWRIVRGLTK